MRAAMLAAALLVAVPATAQPTAYEQAVTARLGGEPARAVELLEPLVRAEPRNADAWVQLGYARLALGRLDEARAAFDRALEIAPEYEDARDGLRRVSERRSAAPPRFRLEIDGSTTWIGGGQPDWREASAQLRAELRSGIAVTGRIEAARRFGRSDAYLEGRIDSSTKERAFGYLLAGGTPGADFRPEVQLGAGIGARLVEGPNPTVVAADLRWARYKSGAVWTLNPGIEQYLAGGRVWISARWINIFDDGRHAGGWLVRGDVQASDRFRLFAGAAHAPDLSEGIAIDTVSIFGGVSVDIDDRHSVRLSLSRDKPEGGSDRTQLAIGTGLKF